MLIFELQVVMGVIYPPVKGFLFIIHFWPGYKLLKNDWFTVLLFLVIRKIEKSTLLKRVVVWKTENINLLRYNLFKRVVFERIKNSTLLKIVVVW